VKPALQKQSCNASLCTAELESRGHDAHACGPCAVLNVPASQATHGKIGGCSSKSLAMMTWQCSLGAQLHGHTKQALLILLPIHWSFRTLAS